MKNRIVPFLLALMILLCGISGPVLALETVDLNRTGTITVEPQVENGAINGEVTLYRVADFDGGDSFAYTDDFAGANLPLDDLESPELAVSLAVYAAVYSVEGDTKIFENNSATFPAKAGLYLVVHTGALEGENTFVPFLVVFPGTDGEQADYDVVACPKTGPLPDFPDWPDWPDWPDVPDEPDNPTVPSETEPEETEPDSTQPSETKPEESQPDSTEPDSTSPSTPVEDEKLPQTGQLNWPVPLLAGLGMALFIAGWVLRFRERKEDYDA